MRGKEERRRREDLRQGEKERRWEARRRDEETWRVNKEDGGGHVRMKGVFGLVALIRVTDRDNQDVSLQEDSVSFGRGRTVSSLCYDLEVSDESS